MGSVALSSLRGRLLSLLCVIILLFCVVLVYSALELQSRESSHVQQNALALARLIKNARLRQVDDTRNFLPLLAELQRDRLLEGKAVCDAMLSELLASYPQYANLGVIDLDGSLRCSALPAPSNVNLADRSYFRRALETGGVAVGDYQVGRLTQASTINIAQPIRDPQDRVRAVLYAALDLEYLSADRGHQSA